MSEEERTYFVVATKGFNNPKDADKYAQSESTKTRAKYAVLVRDSEIGPTLSTVAVYKNGERRLRAEYVTDE